MHFINAENIRVTQRTKPVIFGPPVPDNNIVKEKAQGSHYLRQIHMQRIKSVLFTKIHHDRDTISAFL